MSSVGEIHCVCVLRGRTKDSTKDSLDNESQSRLHDLGRVRTNGPRGSPCARSRYAPTSHVDMKYPEDFRIPVRMPFRTFFLIFMSQGHKIRVGRHVDQVLHTAQVVGHVVDG